MLQFDAAVAFALSAERNFLLDKFSQAYNKLKELSVSNPTTTVIPQELNKQNNAPNRKYFILQSP